MTEQKLSSYNYVVLDIEGTTTPISFVHDILFPYVTKNLEKFLHNNWASQELQKYVQELRKQAEQDYKEGMPEAKIIPEENEKNTDEVIKSVIHNIEWQMKADRKIGALKSFQGYMWKFGYESGELESLMYDDVLVALNKWKEAGIKIYIYSSGSIAAQKLLFGYTNKGNLLEYFSGHYDTSIGSKLEESSYINICKNIGSVPSKILFLSDNVKEINAAKKAGFQTAIIQRPENPPLSERDLAENLITVETVHKFQSMVEAVTSMKSVIEGKLTDYLSKFLGDVLAVVNTKLDIKVNKVDTMIIHSDGLLEELDKVINTYGNETYSFPPEDLEKQIKEAAGTSMDSENFTR
ncbi:4801_t:CDS:10 [Entrophospora sp. SA101]|nr:10800_t:CDS:10 [Entrophospora sp. SA101]CAJ0649639.1 4214_t:CDS:10 [Entrophospora sp. SA101]CAJ0765517.1 4801_t:CDS:10 [Entrophospora sp. SA101]CAJ0831793.1 9952_t:CDS:10 [Entrophospora sp. SA101]CAJ0836438.1 15491_t:CDS:10 [Entrophospora sp. SA101]